MIPGSSSTSTTITDEEVRANERRRVQRTHDEILRNRENDDHTNNEQQRQQDETVVHINVNKRKNWESYAEAQKATEKLPKGMEFYRQVVSEPTAVPWQRNGGRSSRQGELPPEFRQRGNRGWRTEREEKNPEMKRRQEASSAITTLLK